MTGISESLIGSIGTNSTTCSSSHLATADARQLAGACGDGTAVLRQVDRSENTAVGTHRHGKLNGSRRHPRARLQAPVRRTATGVSVSARAAGSMPTARIGFGAEVSVQRIAQGLAALAECGRDDRTVERCARPMRRRLLDAQPYDRRVHPRRRLERTTADLEQSRRVHARRQHDAETPVLAAARRRDDTIDHLPLQHEMHVGDRIGGLQQPEQQRRRDVVGQVADDPQSCAASGCQRAPIDGRVHRPCAASNRIRRGSARAMPQTGPDQSRLRPGGRPPTATWP